MPNIKSAIKRVKTNEKRRALNASQRSALRTAVKTADQAIAGADVEAAKFALITASKKLDMAVTTGKIHNNAAPSKKSRIAKRVNALSAQAQEPLDAEPRPLVEVFLCVVIREPSIARSAATSM